MTLDIFKRLFKEWQDHEKKYTFFAANLGLGSIVHLLFIVHPICLKSMTKSGELEVNGVKPS
jgi:hypothetical protein